ncbi:hypothetical protein [Cellulomonas dongxiuzhuiae]|nr:hypothetical protein [Cellulomonas dongxiuzhuiae]MBO3086939.1 hypothetical protein [Cellulomonas dongxiuzhuiae]
MMWLVVTPSLTLVVLAVLVRTVRADGLGHRPPPPSRPGGERDRAW